MIGSYYYIDKIRVLFCEYPVYIAKKICMTDLKKHCKTANLMNISQSASWCRFKSRLQVSAPDYEALNLLVIKLKNLSHTISHIEIAYDHFCPNKLAAELKAKLMMQHIHMKYARKVTIYDSEKRPKSVKTQKPQDGLFSDVTGYFGDNSLKYVIYPRSSKFSGWPCLHVEWRLKGSSTIKKLIKLKSLANISSFDYEANFLKLKERFISYEEINHVKHGRFVQNMHKNQKNPGIVKSGRFAGASLLPPFRASHVFMRGQDIETSGGLRSFYIREKKRIKQKIKKGIAVTPLEAKLNKLNNTRLNGFFRPVPEPV